MPQRQYNISGTNTIMFTKPMTPPPDDPKNIIKNKFQAIIRTYNNPQN